MKQVLVLVGPKGAGKSTIGHLLSTELGIEFLRVEPLFLRVRSELGASDPRFERRGFELVLDAVREALQKHDTVCFETTGASALVPWLLSEIAKVARVLPVHVVAGRDQCVERIHTRDASIHIPVSDDQVERINAIAEKAELPWIAEIDNRGEFDARAVIEVVKALVRS